MHIYSTTLRKERVLCINVSCLMRMGIISDDAVVIKEAEEGHTVITINCPDKTGLGCDLSRVILLYGLNITRGDIQTDGKWCFVVFWVTGKPTTGWNVFRERLLEVCPKCTPAASTIYYYRPEFQAPKPLEVFLLKFCCSNVWTGLLHDIAKALCQMELRIQKVKVSNTPDGKIMNLFFLADSRQLLHTEERREETTNKLKDVLGEALISSETELSCSDFSACLPSPLQPPLTEDMFSLEGYDDDSANPVTVCVDNNLSHSHTLLQISCIDQKGLIYDIMRTIKGYNYQKGVCEADLFVMQADKNPILCPEKQNTLCTRLKVELACPLKVDVFIRGDETELLVANPVELSRKGRPLVFFDITFVLKKLKIGTSSVETGRHWIHNREWEVFRILLDESGCSTLPRNKIKECVRNKLMGWE